MGQIPSEPLWFEVRLGAAVEEALLFELGEERDGSGRPNMNDLLRYWWPQVEAAVNYGWRASAPVTEYANLPNEVRELPLKPILSFPPSRVVVARTTSEDSWPYGELTVVGVSFDWTAWTMWADEESDDS